LDFGTGDGTLLCEICPNPEFFVGVDPHVNTECLPSGASFVKSIDEINPPTNLFTVIFALAVLEHLTEVQLRDFASKSLALSAKKAALVCTVPSPKVDWILPVLRSLRLLDGMAIHEHHGTTVEGIVKMLTDGGWSLVSHSRFQLGLNNLMVFQNLSE
jgi:hypothetical protein